MAIGNNSVHKIPKSPLEEPSPRKGERIEQYLNFANKIPTIVKGVVQMDEVIFYISQSRAVEARLAHNQKVAGSNPVSAIQY